MRRVGFVSQLWRYPVVGLQGETLKTAEIVESGIRGDRAYQLRDHGGKILGPVPQSSSPTERSILALRASIDETGEGGVLKLNLGDGVTSTKKRDFGQRLEKAVGVPVRLEESTVLATRAKHGRAVHLVSNASLRELKKVYPGGDFDVRRFRPNVVIELSDGGRGFAEEAWVGESLKVGAAVLRVESPNERCTVTTMPQANLLADKRILETIVDANNRNLGIMCSVERSGRVAVGDSVFVGDNLPT